MTRPFALLFCLLGICGCTIFPRKPNVIQGLQAETATKYKYVNSQESGVGKMVSQAKALVAVPLEDQKYFRTAYNDAQGEAEKRIVRDAILYDLLGVVDADFRNYEMQLRDDRNIKDLSTTLVAMGLTSAATLTGGAETKAILSAIATGVLGANAVVDKQLFKDFATEALIDEMRAKRADVATQMITKIRMLPDAQYPLEAGLQDIVNYYYAGSVTNALQTLIAEAATRAKEAEAKKAVAETMPAQGGP